jgi:integrase
MRKKLTVPFIKTLKPGPKRIEVYDTAVTGLALMITETGHKSFPVRGRIRGGDGRSVKLATLPIELGLERARREARKVLELAADGKDPREIRKAEARAKAEARTNTFAAVAARFMVMEGRRGLRAFKQVERSLHKYVLGRLGARPITEIRKSDVSRLFQEVGEGHGLRTAECAVQHVVAVMNWHARQVDDFVNPVPRGHIRTQTRKRNRALGDHEITALWKATEPVPGRPEPYRSIVRLLLLTGRRRGEVAEMTWAEITPEGHLLPAERNKVGVPLLSSLAPAVRAIIAAQPRLGPLVFSKASGRPVTDWAALKVALDTRMLAILRERDPAAELPPWCLHDLRRTARTLMSRLRVPTDIGERCLGHVIGGVRAAYDLHEYFDEKREAFEALANEIARIVGEPPKAPAVPQTMIEPSVEPVPAGGLIDARP